MLLGFVLKAVVYFKALSPANLQVSSWGLLWQSHLVERALNIMRCWRTFGIHFLIKGLEDGAEELSISTGSLSPKMLLACTQILQGLVLPEDTDPGAGIQPAHQMARRHWACLWCTASKVSGSLPVDIYIAIYLGDGDGEIPNCLLAIRVGAVKKYWIHNCIWPPQRPRLKSLWKLFSVFNFFSSIEEPLEEKYYSFSLKIGSAGML